MAPCNHVNDHEWEWLFGQGSWQNPFGYCVSNFVKSTVYRLLHEDCL